VKTFEIFITYNLLIIKSFRIGVLLVLYIVYSLFLSAAVTANLLERGTMSGFGIFWSGNCKGVKTNGLFYLPNHH
jgi:hypothetical protein